MSNSDAGSVSSYGSAHASVQQLGKPGDVDDELQSSWINGLFGVLYTVSKEKERQTWKFVAFRLVLDALQLFLLTVNPLYGWNINADSTAWRVVSFIQLNQFMSDRGYTFFLVCFYIMVVGLWAVVVLSAWVGWSFSLSRFDYVWPIAVLRVYANVFFQVLEIASMTLLLMALDCQYFDVPEGEQFVQQEFGIACFQPPHVIHVLVAAVSLLVFVALASLFQLAEMELNPLSRNPLAVAHSRVELEGFLLKAFMTCASVFVTNYKWLSLVYFFSMLILVRQYLTWQPHMATWVNHVRVGSYSGVLYSALLLLPMAFKGAEDMDALRTKLTVALWAGLVPVSLLGAAASYLRTRYFAYIVLGKFRSALPGTRPRSIYAFTDSRQVEVVARCCRCWVEGDEEVVDPRGVGLAEEVLKAGMSQLPKDPYMIILYSSFLIDVQSSYQSGYLQLQRAKQGDTNLLHQFAIYSREQQHTQKSSGAGDTSSSGGVSLMSFVEYNRNYRLVVRVHRDALMALRQFWQSLLHNRAQLYDLTQAVKRVDAAVRSAERVYKMVLARHGQSVKIVKLYARFLEDVKQDPWNASKWFMEAEHLEQSEEDARAGNIFTELGIDPASADAQALAGFGDLLNMKSGILGNTDARSVIIINARGLVQLVNPTVEKMFGYTKAEIKGRNVSLVIPPPFDTPHDGFIRSHVATGKEGVIGRTTTFVALHKERHVFGVKLQVTKIAGMGEDSLFMGVVTACPASPGATIWVMLGSEAVVSCDSTFTDWFGYRADELLGKGVDEWVLEPGEIQEVFAGAKQLLASAIQHPALPPLTPLTAVDSASPLFPPTPGPISRALPLASACSDSGSVVLSRRSWVVRGVMLRHKYSEAAAADVNITVGGIGSHKLFVCEVQLVDPPRMLVVSDKAGRVVHASQALADALRMSTKALMANGSPGALQQLMPQPFSTLHNSLMATPLTPGLAPPPHSCRAGLLPVLLNTAVKDSAPLPRPFRLALTRREVEGERLTVSTLTQMNVVEALGPQRLKLVVDADGTVVAVLAGDAQAFGFDPKLLINASASEFLDVFTDCLPPSPVGSSGEEPGSTRDVLLLSEPGAPPPAPAPPLPSLHKVLKALALRVRDRPGCSFRVGLLSPVALMADPLSSEEDAAGLMGRADTTVPAIMTVSMNVGQRGGSRPGARGAAGPGSPAPAGATHSPGISTGLSPRPPDQAAAAVLEAGASSTTRPRPPSPRDVTAHEAAAKPPTKGITFTIELWRAELAGGVLEVNKHGLIASTPHAPLYSAGLMLGVPTESMVGQHLSAYFPAAEGRAIADLLKPGWGLGASGGAVAGVTPLAGGQQTGPRAARSSMKGAAAGGPKNGQLVGAPNVVRLQHVGDGGVTEVVVTAVKKVGGSVHDSGGVYLVLRPHEPRAGRPDFATWLLQRRRAAGSIGPVDTNGFAPSARSSALLTSSLALSGLAGLELLAPVPENAQVAVQAEPQSSSSVRLRPDFAQIVMTANESQGDAASPTQPMASAESPASDPNLGYLHRDSALMLPVATSNPQLALDSFELQPRNSYKQDGRDGETSDDDDGDADPTAPRYTSGATSELDDAPDTEVIATTDYRRGQRFKGLMKMLNSPKAQAPLRTFRLHSYAVLACIVLVHVSLYALQNQLVSRQSEDVRDLYSVGVAAQQAGELLHHTMEMNLALGRRLDLEAFHIVPAKAMKEYKQNIDSVTDLHRGVYFGFGGQNRVMPAGFGLRRLWEEDVLAVTDYVEAWPATKQVTVNMSLWNLGNKFLGKASNIWLNGPSYAMANSSLESMVDYRFVVDNGPYVLLTGYYDTMDGFLELVIQQAHTIAANQLIVLVMEGAVVTLLVTAYVWVLASKVTHFRFDLYAVFMSVPVGLVRALATAPVVLDEEDEEEAEEAAALNNNVTGNGGSNGVSVMGQQGGGASIGAGDTAACSGYAGKSAVRVSLPGEQPEHESHTRITIGIPAAADKAAAASMSGAARKASLADSQQRPSPLSALSDRFKGMFASMAGRRPGGGKSSKRQLVITTRFSLWLVWPLIVWGVINISINSSAQTMLNGVDGPIATFNLVNSLSARIQRTYYLAQELCSHTDPASKAYFRDRLGNVSLPRLKKEYAATLRGSQATPEDQTPHFALATQGVLQAGGRGLDILYGNNCLRADQSACSNDPTTDPNYEYTHGGLDRLLRRLLDVFRAMAESGDPAPDLSGPEFAFLWDTMDDVKGGLDALVQAFHQYVEDVYTANLTLYTANLAVSIVIGLAYALFILRPFIAEMSVETRRVAELLSQLPSEIAVEDSLAKALLGSNGGIAPLPAAGQDANGTMSYPGDASNANFASLKMDQSFQMNSFKV